MKPQQRLRKGFTRVLKYTLNPLTLQIARSSSGLFSIVRHVGRRSGKTYETPIIVSSVKDGFVIELTYRPDVDWYKNVIVARGCTLIWHSMEYVIDQIESLDAETGRADFPPLQQRILRLLGRKHFENMVIHKQELEGV